MFIQFFCGFFGYFFYLSRFLSVFLNEKADVQSWMIIRSFSWNFNNQFSFFSSIDCWCGKFKKEQLKGKSITVRWKERKCLFVDVIFFLFLAEDEKFQTTCLFLPGLSYEIQLKIKKIAVGDEITSKLNLTMKYFCREGNQIKCRLGRKFFSLKFKFRLKRCKSCHL